MERWCRSTDVLDRAALIAKSSGGGVSKMDARGVDVAAAARQGFANMAAKKTHAVDSKTRIALNAVFMRFDTELDGQLS